MSDIFFAVKFCFINDLNFNDFINDLNFNDFINDLNQSFIIKSGFTYSAEKII